MAFGSSFAGLLGGSAGGSVTGGAIVRLLLDASQFEAGLRSSQGRLATASQSMSRMGGTLTRGVSLPLAAAGAVAVKLAVDYESAFTRIRANTNLSEQDIARLRQTVLDLAGKTAKSPQELAEGLYFLASAGLSARQVTETLTMSAKASAAGFGEVGDIARLTANALNAYAKEGLTAKQVTDTLAAAVREGTAEPQEFALALGRILPIAQKAGVGFDEVTASLASLSNIGLDVNEGVTAMRGLLQSLVAPTNQTEDALKKLGLSTEELRGIIADQGVLAALRLLEERTGGNIDKLRDLVPNVRAITGMFGITGQKADKVSASFARVADASGDLDKAFAKTAKDPGFQMRQTLASLQAMAIEIGTEALPVLKDVAQVILELIEGFRDLPEPLQENIIKWGLLAIALGPVLKLMAGILGIGSRLIGVLPKAGAAAGAGAAAASAGSAAAGAGAAAGGAATGMAAFLAGAKRIAGLGATLLMLNELRKAWVGLRHDQDAANRELGESVRGFLRERRAMLGGQEGIEAYSKATEGVTGLKVKQQNTIGTLIGAYQKLGVKLDDVTLKQVNNLLSQGDLSSALQLLKERLREGTEKFGSFGTAAERARNRAQEVAIKVDAARQAIENLPKKPNVHFSETGLDEMIAKVQGFAQSLFGLDNASVSFSGPSTSSPRPKTSGAVGRSGKQPSSVSSVVLVNQGIIGSQAEMDQWLERGMDRLYLKRTS